MINTYLNYYFLDEKKILIEILEYWSIIKFMLNGMSF